MAYKRRVLAEDKLDFKKAMEIAENMETAEKNLKELQKPTVVVDQTKTHCAVVHTHDKFMCTRCGKRGHRDLRWRIV